MTFEAAATVGLCGLTAAQGLFYRSQLSCPFVQTTGFDWLNLPDHEPVNIFVYGATTSVGLYAAQLIRLSGKASERETRLLGAASSSKHELLRKAPYSYDVLVDYKHEYWPEQIKAATSSSQGVHYALDTFSVSPSVELTESILGPQGRFAVFRAPALGGFDMEMLGIKPIIGAVWEGLGVEIQYQGQSIYAEIHEILSDPQVLGAVTPPNPDARKFAAAFYRWLGSGAEHDEPKLTPNAVRICQGGLQGIADDGLDLIGPNAKGQVALSAEKAVYVV